MSPLMPRPAIAVPLLICLALGALVARETLDPGPSSLDPVPHVAPAGARAGTAPRSRISGMPPLAAYADFLARPPFSETRRPPETASLAAGEHPPFRLAGIVIAGDGRLGLFARDNKPVLSRVAEGQVLDGWRVERILADRVILQNASRRLTLTFGSAGDAPEAASAQAAKPVAPGTASDRTAPVTPPTHPPPPGVKREFPYALSPNDMRWSTH